MTRNTSLDCIKSIAVFTRLIKPTARREEEPMRVYEAIVRGLESIGADAAFSGAGENAAGMMIALKHSQKIRSVITRSEQAASFAACTRLAIPHSSPSPKGTIAGVVETLTARLHGA
jgi:Thiamine pyrophosphate enzyme, N-terminal TPP binding domain